MKVPVWAAELAAEFWRVAGDAERFPRDLRVSVPRALPLSIFLIADLSLYRIQDWLQKNGVACATGSCNRRLRAGLVVRGGHGIAFLDGMDSDDEQRFSLAHELGHFLREFWRLRRLVQARLGSDAVEVIDGLRSATADERFQSLLGFAPTDFHAHLLVRGTDGDPATRTIAQAEEDADRLAFELLAPAEHVVANVPNWQDRSSLQDALITDYGLPCRQAVRYACALLPRPRQVDPLLRQLKISE